MKFSEYISGQNSISMNEGLIDSIKGFFKRLFSLETQQDRIVKAAKEWLKASVKADVYRIIERVYEYSDWGQDAISGLKKIAKKYNFSLADSKVAMAIKVPKAVEKKIEDFIKSEDGTLNLDDWEPTEDEVKEIRGWFYPGGVGISIGFELVHSGSFKTQDYLKLAKEVERSFASIIKGARAGGDSNRRTHQNVEVATKDGVIYGRVTLEN